MLHSGVCGGPLDDAGELAGFCAGMIVQITAHRSESTDSHPGSPAVRLPEQLLSQVCMTLALLVKAGKVRHRQHGRPSPGGPPNKAASRRSSSQSSPSGHVSSIEFAV